MKEFAQHHFTRRSEFAVYWVAVSNSDVLIKSAADVLVIAWIDDSNLCLSSNTQILREVGFGELISPQNIEKC